MDAAELFRFKTLLLQLKEEALTVGDLEIEPTQRDPFTKPDADDDQPLSEMQQVITSQRNRARTGSLQLIMAALRRLEEDPEQFGHCLECDDPINHKRLELMPYTTMCVRCQSEREDHPRKGGRRRHLTDFK